MTVHTNSPALIHVDTSFRVIDPRGESKHLPVLTVTWARSSSRGGRTKNNPLLSPFWLVLLTIVVVHRKVRIFRPGQVAAGYDCLRVVNILKVQTGTGKGMYRLMHGNSLVIVWAVRGKTGFGNHIM